MYILLNVYSPDQCLRRGLRRSPQAQWQQQQQKSKILQKPNKLWLHKKDQNSNFRSENLTRMLFIVRLRCVLSVSNWIVEAFQKSVYMYLSCAVLCYGHLQHLLGLGWAGGQKLRETSGCVYSNVHGRVLFLLHKVQIYVVKPWLPASQHGKRN
jgi:hypothetical protein